MEIPQHKTVAFLPWLKLAKAVTIGKTRFVPFRVPTGSPELPDLAPSFTKILSSYVDLWNRPLETCTVATLDYRQPAWNVRSEDFERVSEDTSMLYLASMAANEYFQAVGHYVNRTMFNLYWQRFSEPVEYMTVTVRRRDGEQLLGGAKHGEAKLLMPAYAQAIDPAAMDDGFAEGLNKALAANSKLVHRLKPALAFLSLANTDSDEMGAPAEVILMASAFEQLLDVNRGAREAAQRFSELFHQFGGVTVDECLTTRRGILLNPKYATAQKKWFAHKKWMEELYDLRSYYVHGNDLTDRTWGWIPLEHLVMAAFAFPLAVKLALLQQGHYTLSREDQKRCWAMDLVLTAVGWPGSRDSSLTVWQEKLLASGREPLIRAAVEALQKSRRAVESR